MTIFTKATKPDGTMPQISLS